ncbi:MAG: hypothetical protein GY701_10040 [Sulfitobacter sp.]|nr:hypothetical protein [Sulfitobacter sp.]
MERLTNTRWALGVATTTTVTMVTGIRLESGPLVVGAGLFIMALATGTAVASLAKGIPEGRPVAIAAGLFAASHLAAPAAQPAALWLFEDDFVSFAEDVRAGNMPDTESFRVGPYSYDSVCPTNDGDVTIWHSGDDFITVQTVVVHPDGAITDGALGESSSFVYDCNRRRLDHG